MHERRRTVERVEIGGEQVEADARRDVGAEPAREPEPVTEPTTQREGVERALVAHGRELGGERLVERAQVVLHQLRTEQIVGEGATTVEQFRRELAQEHAVVGQALARITLRQCVERAQPGIGEHEEVSVVAGLDGERVAELRTRRHEGWGGRRRIGVVPRESEPGHRHVTHRHTLTRGPRFGRQGYVAGMTEQWTIIGETGTAIGGIDDTARLTATDLATVTGWEPKAQGWCRGAECIPASLIGDVAATPSLSVGEIGEALAVPVAIDAEHRIAVIGSRADAASSVASGVAPDVELTAIDGTRHHLFDGMPAKTMVVAFSSWCGCRYDLPGWKALKDELGDEGFGVVAVAIDESTADVEPWVTNVDYPVLVDTDRAFADAYGLTNVPTILWIDEARNIVRQPSTEFSDDLFTEVHGVESGPHLDAVREWVRSGTMPAGDDAPAPPEPLTDDQRRARVEFRLAIELRRRGHEEAAAERIALADSLAPDDLTIWRAGMLLTGDDPFGAAFFDRYVDWQSRHGGPLAKPAS